MRSETLSDKGLLAVVAAIAVCLFAGSVQAQAFIVKDGDPQAQIIISETPTRGITLGASDLQAYIEKISGAKLPVATTVNDAIPVKIYVGKSEFTDALNLSDEGLEYGAFKMVSGKDWLALFGQDRNYEPRDRHIRFENGERDYSEWDALTGAKWDNPIDIFPFGGPEYSDAVEVSAYDRRGSLNAVYEFLRTLGVRWYFPGELGEVVPKMTSIALPEVNKTVRPDLKYRHLFIYYGDFARGSRDYVLWQLRMGLEQKDGFGGGHGLIYITGRDKSHPEYFALYGGERATDAAYGNGFTCFSSEGLMDEAVKYCNTVFRLYPDERTLSIAPADGYGTICECDLCKGKATWERGWNGMLSDYVWNFMDRVARDVYKTYPDRRVSNLAYSVYQLPPEKMDQLSPNMVAVLCRWRSEFHKEQTHEDFNKLTEAWLEKLPSKELYIWDYYLHNRADGPWVGVPVYYPHIIADDLSFLKGKSRGEFIEISNNWQPQNFPWDAMAVNHLNVYVTSRLYWDADRDVDAMMGEFYEKFYGPVAEEMKGFIEYADANWMRGNKDVAVIDRMFELIGDARDRAGDTVYGRRIGLVATYMERLKPVREKLAKGRDKNLPAALAQERNKNHIKLDGKLDDKFWEGLTEYDLKDLATGDAPANNTTFRVGWAENALYFGITCEDADMENLYVSATEREDANVFNGDHIELLMETPVHSYYQIAVSPTGAVFDMDREDGDYKSTWSSGIEASADRGEGYWSLEMRVPVAGENAAAVDALNGIAGPKPEEGAPWYFNLCRQRTRGDQSQYSAFSPTGRISFHVLDKFGPLTVK